MFETEKCEFYKKAVFLIKAGMQYKTAMPISINNTHKVQFVFSKGDEKYTNEYLCINYDKTNFKEHNKNISEIYRTCCEPSGDFPFIFINICSVCGKTYYTNTHRACEYTCKCNRCHDNEMQEIINGSECKGQCSYVYLIEAKESHSLKIGYSTNPDKRIAKLQTGSKETLKLVGLIRGGVKAEQKLHEMFSVFRERGEWFKDVEEIRDFFIASRNQILEAEPSKKYHGEFGRTE